MEELVQRVVREARINLGGQKNLIAAITPIVGRAYGTQVVSAWERGGARMPAYVFLAVAQAGHISVDELLFGESMSSRQDRLEEELRELRKAIEGAGPPQ